MTLILRRNNVVWYSRTRGIVVTYSRKMKYGTLPYLKFKQNIILLLNITFFFFVTIIIVVDIMIIKCDKIDKNYLTFR